MIYISSPYTHKDPSVVESRIRETEEFVLWLMQQGLSPISIPVHFHNYVTRGWLPSSAEFWEKYYIPILAKAEAVYILMIDGWLESTGIQAESKFATEHGIPVKIFKKMTETPLFYKEME